jgi:four helix bundle protein
MDVWRAAMDFAAEIYRVTKQLPSDERFGLTSQIRRAAVSIPSDIAEGSGRESRRDIRHFIVQARGSLNEVSTQLALCERLGYVKPTDVRALEKQALRLRQLIAGTIKHLT